MVQDGLVAVGILNNPTIRRLSLMARKSGIHQPLRLCKKRPELLGQRETRTEKLCFVEAKPLLVLKRYTLGKTKGSEMPKRKIESVTMRVRVGDKEIEVTGPSGFVEEKIAEFLKQSSGGATTSTSALTSEAQIMQHPKGTSPAQFFKATNSKTDNGRVLLAVYFLEKFRNAQNVTASEIRDLIAESKRNPPSNTSDAVNQNIRKGLLMTAGEKDSKLAFVLTSDGEAEVEEMLKSSKE